MVEGSLILRKTSLGDTHISVALGLKMTDEFWYRPRLKSGRLSAPVYGSLNSGVWKTLAPKEFMEWLT